MSRKLLCCWALLSLQLLVASGEELLKLSVSPEFDSYPCGRQRINAVLSLAAATGLEEKPAVSLTSVIDKSGSMSGEKIELLIRTNQFLVDKLAEEDGKNSLGFVTYSTFVTEPLPLKRLVKEDVGLVKKVVGQTTAKGSTNLSGGLMRGLEQQRDAPKDGPAVKAVFLFTDGVPTMGLRSSEELKRVVQEFLGEVDEPIVVYSFGFGDNLDFNMLVDVAEAGKGLPYIISKKEDIPGAFGDALGGLLSTVAVDLNVTLVPLNGVEIVSIQAGGRDQVDDGDGVQVAIGDMFLEERRDLLVELDVPDGCGSLDVLSVQGGFLSTSGAKRVTTSEETLTISRDKAAVEEEEINPVVETSKMRYKAATAVSNAQGKAKVGNDKGAVTVIANATAVVEVSPLSESEIIQAILSDLKRIKTVLEDQAGTTLERVALMQEVKDALAKQRSVGGSTASGAVLATTAKKEVSDNATGQVLEGTDLQPPAPTPTPAPAFVPPVFEYSFDSEFIDVTDEATTVSAYLNLIVNNPPGAAYPMAVVFIVDSFVVANEERLQTMLDFTKGFLDYILRENNSSKSAMGLILNDSTGIPKAGLTSITKDSVADLVETVENAKISSESNTAEAITTAVGLLKSDKDPRRKIVMAFMGTKIETKMYPSYAEEVTKSIAGSPVPIGVYPVLMELESEGIEQANTLAELTGSSVVFLEEKENVLDTLEEVRDLIIFVAAQNMSVSTSTGNEIEIVDVSGGNFNKSDNDKGVVNMLDLNFGDWRQLKFRLSLPPASGNETLLSLSFDYFDVSAFSSTSKGPLELTAFRASEDVFEARKNARKEVSDTLDTAKDLLESNATDDAVVVIANAIATVNITLADDPIVQDLVNELLAISSLLNKTLAADKVEQEDLSNALDKVNDLEKKSLVLGPDEKLDNASSSPASETRSDSDAQSPLSVTIDPEKLDLTTEAQNVSISMRIETIETTPDLEEGAYVVLLDVSDGMSDNDVGLATKMLVEFVRAISRRQGKRSIDVLIFGKDVETLVSYDDVDLNNVEGIVDSIQNRQELSGFDLEKAVGMAMQAVDGSPRRSLLQAKTQIPEQTVLVCMIGGSRSFIGEELEATLTTAISSFSSAQNLLTVFPILFGENTLGTDLIQGIAYAGNGIPYNIGSKGDIEEIVETIGGWFESIALHSLQLVAAPLSDSHILDFSGPVSVLDESDGKKVVSIPYLFFDEDYKFNISLRIPPAIGSASLLSFSGSYVLGRSQHQLGHMYLFADRSAPTTMRARTRLLDKINESSGEAKEALTENQGKESIVIVSSASARAKASPVKDDPLVKKLGDQLSNIEAVLKYALEDENKDNDALLDAADALSDVKDQSSRRNNQPSGVDTSDNTVNQEKGLELSVAPEFKEYSSDQDTAYASITVKASEALSLVNNPAVTLVLDMTSGLSQGLQALVKDTAKKIITSLRETKKDALLGVVIYGGGVKTILKMQSLTEATESEILSKISSLEAAGDSELLEGLTEGFDQQSDVSGRWQRAIALISASIASANQTDQSIADKVTNLRSGPQNPVSIYSFAASFSSASLELLGSLATSSGGKLFVLSNEEDVDTSGKQFTEGLIQSSVENLRLEIRPVGIGKLNEVVGNVSISDQGIPLIVRIPSLVPGEEKSLNVTMDISLVNASADVLSVEGKYFSRSLFQSVTLVPQTLAIHRVDVKILEERNRVRMEAAKGLSNAQKQLAAGNASSAEETLLDARDVLKVARYQDDPVISSTRRDISDVLHSIHGAVGNKSLESIDLLLLNLEENVNSVGIEPFVKVVHKTISGISRAARKRLQDLANSQRSISVSIGLVVTCTCMSLWL